LKFHTTEPSAYSTSVGQALELWLLTQFCTEEPYILLKQTLYSAQKGPTHTRSHTHTHTHIHTHTHTHTHTHYILLIRAVHSSQKSCSFHKKEPYILHKRALHVPQKSPTFFSKEMFIPYKRALHIFHLCRSSTWAEVVDSILHKRALHSSQKSPISWAKELFIQHKRALHILHLCRPSTWAKVVDLNTSPTGALWRLTQFCTKEPYILLIRALSPTGLRARRALMSRM